MTTPASPFSASETPIACTLTGAAYADRTA